MRRLRQQVESGGFPLKRVGAGAALIVVAIVALILWARPDAPDEEELTQSYGAIVCLPEDADEGSGPSAGGPAPSDEVASGTLNEATATSPTAGADQDAPALFYQNQGSWAGSEYDHHGELAADLAWCGTSIAQCGCAMTSLGNVLSVFNIVSTPDQPQLDPGTLNSWLGRDAQLADAGWISKGYFLGDVVWTDIQPFTAALHRENPESPRLRYRGRGNGSVEEIRSELQAGRPVVLAVPRHFIAAVGLDGDDIILLDPFYPERTRLSEYPTAILSSRLFEPADDLSSMLISASSNVGIRVRDPQGRLVGTFAVGSVEEGLAQAVDEIPGASFTFDEMWADPTCPQRQPEAGTGNWTIHIPNPDPGQYTVEIVDPNDEGTCVAVYRYDRDGNVQVDTDCALGDKELAFEYDPAPATLVMSRDSIEFGDVAVGDDGELSLTVTNHSTEPVQLIDVSFEGGGQTAEGFVLEGCRQSSLGPLDSCKLTITFDPPEAGEHRVTLRVFYDGEDSPHIVRVVGTGVPPPLLEAGGSVRFSAVAPGDSETRSLPLRNTGGTSLRIIGASFSNGATTAGAFSLDGCNDVELAGGEECVLTVTFAPRSEGDQAATVRIEHTGSNDSPLTVSVFAGTPSVLGTNPASHNFGPITVGNSGTAAVIVTNEGGGTLTIDGVTVPGGAFSASGCVGASLTTGQSCLIAVDFAPTQAGPASAMLQIAHGGANASPVAIALSGEGIEPPQLGAVPSAIDFPQTGSSSSRTLPLTLTNVGGGSLSVSGVAFSNGLPASGAFSVDGCGAVSLASGETCLATVTFAPQAGGAHSATLLVTHNGANVSPLTVLVTAAPVITAFSCPSQTGVGEVVNCSASVSDGSPWFIAGVAPEGAQIVGPQSVLFSSTGQYVVSITCAGCNTVQAVVTAIVAAPTAVLKCPSSVPSGETFTCDVTVTGATTWDVTAPLDADPSITVINDQTVSVQLFGAGNTYPVVLEACNSVGQCVTATQNVAVVAPSMVIISFGITSHVCATSSLGWVTLNWVVTGDFAGTVALQRRPSPSILPFATIASFPVGSNQFADSVSNSQTWQYRLLATNSLGQSVTSSTVATGPIFCVF